MSHSQRTTWCLSRPGYGRARPDTLGGGTVRLPAKQEDMGSTRAAAQADTAAATTGDAVENIENITRLKQSICEK